MGLPPCLFFNLQAFPRLLFPKKQEAGAYDLSHKEMHMPKASKSITSPFSMRFTPEERAFLDLMAAGLPLSEYIRRKLLSDGKPTRDKLVRSPTQDHEQLSHLMGELGRTRVKNNLSQLKESAHMGILKLTLGVEAAIQQAVSDFTDMRKILVKSLSRSKFPIKERDLISEILEDIRHSDTPDKLNQITKAVNTGDLIYLTEVSAILNICADVAYWRRSLVLALGLEE